MKKIYLTTIYNIDKSWWLSTYVKNLNNLYNNNWIQSKIITPYNQIGFKNFLYNFLLNFSKWVFLINRFMGLKLYYYLLSKIIYISLKKENINENCILHFQDVVSLFYLSKFLKLDNKKILTLHWDLTNMNLSDKIAINNSDAYKYSLDIEKKWYEFADKIIAVDERLKNHTLNFGITENKIKNFPNFTDISLFSPISLEEKNNLRKKYNIPLEKKIIFCPRRLVKKNWVIYTIDIINKLSDEFVLIITGEWQERNNVLQKIDNLWVKNKIILTWDIPNNEIKNYYLLSDLVIVPSVNSDWVIEATSISAIESMACWVPVIASNIWGLTELIQDWYNWFLAEEKNISEFTEKITNYFSLSQEEKEIIIKNSTDSVKDNFSSESYIEKIKKFIF